MSNDFLNHLDAREKELWAELEKIDATRKLWQEPQQIKTVQRKDARPIVRKHSVSRRNMSATIDTFNPIKCIEDNGGLQAWKHIEKAAGGKIWITVIQNEGKGPAGHTCFVQIIDRRNTTISGQPIRKSLVWCKTKDEAQQAKLKLLSAYELAKLNN